MLAVGTAALAAAAFSSLVDSEWPSAGPWPARAFTAVAAASVVTGAYPYALGLACALLALNDGHVSALTETVGPEAIPTLRLPPGCGIAPEIGRASCRESV